MNRPPFDLVEAEEEMAGGFNTEYSAIGFALFYLAEFTNVITMSAIIVTLFLGGPDGPAYIAGIASGSSGSSSRCSSSSSPTCGSAPPCPASATTSSWTSAGRSSSP